MASLEVGKSADIISVDLSAIETQPVFDPVSHLVYACGREQVQHVWVAGQHLLNQRELTTLDIPQLTQKARDWHGKLSQS